ncbi:D-glycero-alpha-D-manno-heptose-1,7-bisphosphate 7-phosphatase [Paracidobacterium acidisoli]|uniref:D,D-heptose 1,7-bisphosphate phosphatase n=1 Tax=Paracidobacterium acidisoli TaxID=2303751 RepID=A0A372IT74_9BACT|nr:HAD-IIIA family hydrolase [Paracidobacterium acidisoli]MBT9329486.1 HAD-IIIA family hydrolase [Paracidobacterium acidisoli]
MGIDRITARRGIFLDRDGVINRNILYPDTGRFESPRTIADFHLVENAVEAMQRLQRAGYLLFLVSNQPNYALGKSDLHTLQKIHLRLKLELDAGKIAFSAFYYCLHHPRGIVPGYSGNCACRKPSPASILRAQREFHLDLANSWMIGDRSTDTECGRAAGVGTIRIADELTQQPVTDPNAGFIASGLAEAAMYLLAGMEPVMPQRAPSDRLHDR